jgi:hypothetical protein
MLNTEHILVTLGSYLLGSVETDPPLEFIATGLVRHNRSVRHDESGEFESYSSLANDASR